MPGIWRFKNTFDLPPEAPVVSLGEGNTPLIWDKQDGKRIGFKLEGLNPTGSHKDRGTAVLVSQLLGRGACYAVEDSSGNAGASFAAYAARSGINARIFVPAYASGPKRAQIETYGVELVKVPGPRSAAAEAVLKDVQNGAVYASHAYLPFGIAGLATIAYEIWEDLKDSPGTVIAPAGHGSLLLGIIRGFSALKQQGLINSAPYYVGVQARACAPIWHAYKNRSKAIELVDEGETLAEGVRVRNPVCARALLEEITPGTGEFIAIDEEKIFAAYHQLASRGLHVEITSAIVWSALCEIVEKVPEPIILILSGSGLKNNVSVQSL